MRPAANIVDDPDFMGVVDVVEYGNFYPTQLVELANCYAYATVTPYRLGNRERANCIRASDESRTLWRLPHAAAAIWIDARGGGADVACVV